MHTYICREHRFGALIPLQILIQQLPTVGVVQWRFREITVYIGAPFGTSALDFEERTRNSSIGLCLTNEEFDTFLSSDVQIIDGYIDAMSGIDETTALFTIECLDASQWEVRTENDEIVPALERLKQTRFFENNPSIDGQ